MTPDPDPILAAAWRRYGRVLVVAVTLVAAAAGAIFMAGSAEARLDTVETTQVKHGATLDEHGRGITSLEKAQIRDSWNIYVLCKAGGNSAECKRPTDP